MLTASLNSSIHSKMQWTKAYRQYWFMSGDSSNWNTWGYHPCGGDNLSAISSSWVNTLLQLLLSGSRKRSDAKAAFPKIAKGVTPPTRQISPSLFPRQCPRKFPSPLHPCMHLALSSACSFLVCHLSLCAGKWLLFLKDSWPSLSLTPASYSRFKHWILLFEIHDKNAGSPLAFLFTNDYSILFLGH